MARSSHIPQAVTVLLLVGLSLVPRWGHTTSLTGNMAPPDSAQALSPKDNVVKKYLADCRVTPARDSNCDKIRKEAIEILKDDVLTLGSSANRGALPMLLTIFKSDELELRIAVVDAIGMIGPTDADVAVLARLANDPVPDVRKSVGQMLQRSKAPAVSLLSKRAMGLTSRSGHTPEAPVDAGKYSMPVAPESTYLFYDSNASNGRLSYVVKKDVDQAMAFFKSKAKQGPLKLDEFNTTYRDQLSDEHEARQQIWTQAREARSKRMEAAQKDTSNPQAALDQIMQIQGDMLGQSMMELTDRYQADFFESPMVFILEERQIGSRTYPTRYVVLYQDKALRKPGYRLSWMTAPDDAVKAAQATSVMNRTREEAQKKREAELQDIVKKKNEQEKKKFKKGQSDLEKELGF